MGGREPTGTSRAATCPRIFAITAGSSILAMTLTFPAHCTQVAIYMPNTRFSRCAQVMAQCGSAGVRASMAWSAGWPRPAGITPW